MAQLFRVIALTVVLLLAQAQPTAAAPEVVQYTLTGGNQFPGPGFENFDPLVSPGGPIASGSLTVTLYAAGCSSPPVSGSLVCLRNFAFLTTQGQGFVANRVLADSEKASALTFAAGDSPFSAAVADVDDDTIPDLVTANYSSDDVSVLLGNGDGSFQAAVSFPAGDGSQSIAVADLDGDTIPDLVTANRDSDDVSVLLGNGDGSFQAAVSFPAGDSPNSVAVADLDGDTIPDLVTANQVSADLSVLLGNGDGSFQAAVSFAAESGAGSVAVADLDGDTIPDLVTANLWSDDSVSVLLGNGDGSFQAAVSFAMRYRPRFVVAADLDGDAIPDLVTTSYDNVSMQLGNGDGSFQAAVSFATGDSTWSVAVADLDDDAIPDVVTANIGSDNVSVLLGNGDGTFPRPAYRGPGLAIDLHLTASTFPYSGSSTSFHFRTALNLRADEAGRLEPNGTRTPLFSQTQGGDCYSFGGCPDSASGTFIVGREVPEPTSTSLTLAALATVAALARLKHRQARTTWKS
jgi:hypothetical protein